MKNLFRILALVFAAVVLFGTAKLIFIITELSDDGSVKNSLFFYVFATLISCLILMVVIRLMINNESNNVEREIEGLKTKIEDEKSKVEQTNQAMKKLEEGNRFALMIADFAALMQSSSDLGVLAENVITKLCTELDASQGAFFIQYEEGDVNRLRLIAGYAYHIPESTEVTFEFGEGLAGQVAKEGKIFNFDSVPEGYVQILSGLGESTPKHLIILPLNNDKEVLGVIEIASFKAFNEGHVEFLNKLSSLFGAGLKRIMSENKLTAKVEQVASQNEASASTDSSIDQNPSA